MKTAYFLDGKADSYYVVVDGYGIPALWAEHIDTRNKFYEEHGWDPSDPWTAQFFEDIRSRKKIVLCREDSPYYKGIKAIWEVENVQASNTLSFALVKKLEELKGIAA